MTVEDRNIPTLAAFLHFENSLPYYTTLSDKLIAEYTNPAIRCFPSTENIMRAMKLCAPEDTRVVILGQDPYHTAGMATGLAFANPERTEPPAPSLANILKEVGPHKTDCTLTSWAKQGVLLLNTILTVREGQPLSHKDIGWEIFTDHYLEMLAKDPLPKVFVLWGGNAKKKKPLIKSAAGNHLILEAAHPSPLSANRGFFGCGHFEAINAFLGDKKIEW